MKSVLFSQEELILSKMPILMISVTDQAGITTINFFLFTKENFRFN